MWYLQNTKIPVRGLKRADLARSGHMAIIGDFKTPKSP